MREAFDVFFSYSTADHASVERVARALHDRGIRIFLDRWYLAAGQPWPQALEQTLASCNAVAIFLGASGLGPWQQRERDLALDRQGREAGFPVIPVLLAGSDPALGFLRLNTWVDLSADSGEEALDLLVAAIRGKPPGPLGRQQAETARAAVCPYRGLRPFREEDEPFFFGRIAFTETLVAAVARKSFVAVVGASGSGKSSVVRAGLIPRLRRGENGRIWEAVSFVPTERPLASMAAALLPLLEPDLTEVDRLTEVGKLARALGDGEVALRDVTARILAKQPGTEQLLLFVDQWEELYTLCQDEAGRTAFAGHLLDVAGTAAFNVVLTVRADFMGRALANRELSDRLQDGIVTIGPMTRSELAETIIRPAEKTGLVFEPGLVETILDEVGHEPGGLPLLEFLLEALWNERRAGVLHYEAYQKLGRVAGAIAHRAEEVFARKLDDAEREAAQRLLIRMVRPGEGVEDTRQRATMPVADPVAEATIRKLADARLVVTEQDAATGRETVEVAHEALIRRWQRLRRWVDQDREFLQTRERIAGQSRLWEDEGEPADRLLAPGRPLAEGEDLLATRRLDLDPELVAYIEASAAAAKAEENEKRTSQRRRLRLAKSIAAGMVVLTVLACVAAWSAWNFRAQSEAKNILGIIVESRETTLDLQRWQETTIAEVAEKVKKSLAISKNRFVISRTGEHATEFVHRIGTSSGIVPEVRCLHPDCRVVSRDVGEAARAANEWDIIFDISDLKLEETMTLEFSVLFWNSFQSPEQCWSGFRILHATEVSHYSVIFPEHKRPRPDTISYVYFDNKEHPYDKELRTTVTTDPGGRAAKVMWEVPFPRGDRSYRVKWDWTE